MTGRLALLSILLAVAGAAPAAAQQNPDTLDLKAIFDAADSVNGVPVVDTLPRLIDCPRFDQNTIRGSQETFSFERRPDLERRMGPVEVTLEFVVGKDGKVERRHIRVIRISDNRLERPVEYWVRTCTFGPGKIGEHAVRVRMRREWKIDLVW